MAVNLFGDRDSWADVPEWNFHTEAAARQLFDGLQILKFEVYDDDGPVLPGAETLAHLRRRRPEAVKAEPDYRTTRLALPVEAQFIDDADHAGALLLVQSLDR